MVDVLGWDCVVVGMALVRSLADATADDVLHTRTPVRPHRVPPPTNVPNLMLRHLNTITHRIRLQNFLITLNLLWPKKKKTAFQRTLALP